MDFFLKMTFGSCLPFNVPNISDPKLGYVLLGICRHTSDIIWDFLGVPDFSVTRLIISFVGTNPVSWACFKSQQFWCDLWQYWFKGHELSPGQLKRFLDYSAILYLVFFFFPFYLQTE